MGRNILCHWVQYHCRWADFHKTRAC